MKFELYLKNIMSKLSTIKLILIYRNILGIVIKLNSYLVLQNLLNSLQN